MHGYMKKSLEYIFSIYQIKRKTSRSVEVTRAGTRAGTRTRTRAGTLAGTR